VKAVAISRYGGPEVLRVVEVPEPHAGPQEVRIRVRAAAVSPADTLIRVGAADAALTGEPPHIPGLEVAGVIDEIGAGCTTNLEEGERVMAMVNPTRPAGGAYAQWVVLREPYVVRSPRDSTDPEASTLPMSGLTARMALDELNLAAGSSLAITGAAGAVGGFAVQLAKADGITVVADASHADVPLVRALGADTVVPRGPDVANRIREAVTGGVDGVIDAALIGPDLLKAIRDGGALAYLRQPGERGGPDRLVSERGIDLRSVFVHRYDGRHDKLDQLRQQVDDGSLTLRVARTYPMDQAPDAHRALEAGGIRGRIVLEF
jgi:NADPH:quinone reductase-like Zn-dependent oxidoreductase